VASSPEFSKLSIGDVVYALPMHVCPTIALHEQVYMVKGKIIKDVWKVIARNRNYRISFAKGDLPPKILKM
jgi:D-serine deaminase-like pyridoxal phosphate-dependent protein